MPERQTIDLHVHSNASDGTLSPEEVTRLADQCGLYAFALTDHDCITGLAQAAQAAKDLEVQLIPGIEITTKYQGEDAHILGLAIDPENETLKNTCQELQMLRTQRNQKIIDEMNRMGFPIDGKTFFSQYFGTSITRMHYARYMADHGYVQDPQEAFAKYLGNGGPLDFPRVKVSPADAVSVIHAAGGHAVLAHPVLYSWYKTSLAESVTDLKNMGIEGIEALYSRNRPEDTSRLTTLAKRLDLFLTGGSDFHGSNKPDISLGTGTGNLHVPKSLLDPILQTD